MKHYAVTRVVAVTTLTCLLVVFALPAAAAPVGTVAADGLWSPSALFQWIQSVWTGWFGDGESAGETGGVRSAHDALEHQLDPDGARASVQTSEDDPTAPWPGSK